MAYENLLSVSDIAWHAKVCSYYILTQVPIPAWQGLPVVISSVRPCLQQRGFVYEHWGEQREHIKAQQSELHKLQSSKQSKCVRRRNIAMQEEPERAEKELRKS